MSPTPDVPHHERNHLSLRIEPFSFPHVLPQGVSVWDGDVLVGWLPVSSVEMEWGVNKMPYLKFAVRAADVGETTTWAPR